MLFRSHCCRYRTKIKVPKIFILGAAPLVVPRTIALNVFVKAEHTSRIPSRVIFSNFNVVLFPPRRPRKRQPWFQQLLAQCAKLKAVRTKNKRSPRMVKRRNSPYASFSRQAQRKQPVDPDPTVTPPVRRRYDHTHLYRDSA